MKTEGRRGTSLIVLVITIIIMIILAAAVILLLNSNNIVSKASEAKSKTDVVNKEHILVMARVEWELMPELERKNTYNNSFIEYAENKIKEAGYDIADIGDIEENTYPKIPAGFKKSIYEGENTVAGGLVIYETASPLVADVEGSTTNRDVARGEYNQYVWIPVEEELEVYDWSQQKSSLNWWTTKFDLSFTQGFRETVPEEIVNNIRENGGFYIARYEAGKPTGAELAGGTTTGLDIDGSDKPLSKKGTVVWNSIKWDANYSWNGSCGNPNNNGAAKVANLAYGADASVTSHLIYGAEWDATLKFLSSDKDLLNTTNWGNYADYTGGGTYTKNQVQLSGSNENWKAKNIYDLAGNLWEWTMEAFPRGEFRIVRGGSYYGAGSITPVADRFNLNPDHGSAYYGFRIALCVK